MLTLKINEVNEGVISYFITNGRRTLVRQDMTVENFAKYLKENDYEYVQYWTYEKKTIWEDSEVTSSG